MLAMLLCIFLSVSPEEKVLIDYFLQNRTENGLVLDRESDKTTVSIAATGFGLEAWAIASQKNIISKEQAITWINQTLHTVKTTNPAKNRGWLYHFMDIHGSPKFDGEVSSIDTAIFYSSARQASYRLNHPPLIQKVEDIIKSIDVNWMLKGDYFSHGLHWENEKAKFIPYQWNEYSEGVILYRLFNKEYHPTAIKYDLPLFVYYYPLCFYKEKEIVNHLRKAIKYQIHRYGIFGFTACDGPKGYGVNEENIVSPLSIWAVEKYSRKSKRLLKKLSVPKCTPSMDIKTRWICKDKIGIDFGSCLILIQ